MQKWAEGGRYAGLRLPLTILTVERLQVFDFEPCAYPCSSSRYCSFCIALPQIRRE